MVGLRILLLPWLWSSWGHQGGSFREPPVPSLILHLLLLFLFKQTLCPHKGKDSFHLSALLLFWFNYLAAPGLTCSLWDLASQPGIKHQPPALGAWSPWTTREVPLPPLWPHWQGRQLDPTGYLWWRCWRPAKCCRHLLCSFVAAPHSRPWRNSLPLPGGCVQWMMAHQWHLLGSSSWRMLWVYIFNMVLMKRYISSFSQDVGKVVSLSRPCYGVCLNHAVYSAARGFIQRDLQEGKGNGRDHI